LARKSKKTVKERERRERGREGERERRREGEKERRR
jgi:hypothetical protein